VILSKEMFDHESMDFNKWAIEERAWAAGFIDGDGMISFYLRGDRKKEFYIAVRAMNTERAPLEKLQLMFGGSICEMGKGDKEKNWAKSWVWSVTHRRAERVLRVLHPFLVCKHKQSIAALNARKLVSDRKSRIPSETKFALEGTERAFREMNRKGL
jgi:hypothetical protein